MKHIVSIIAIMITIPTIAMATDVDIEPGANATCDNGTLRTTDGDVSLRAEWEPHTITLNYYNGDTQYDSNSCKYGGGITLPETNPSKPGYTFKGWRLKQCSLRDYYPGDGDGIGYGYINDSTGQYGPDSSNADTYTLTEDNTWAVKFSNGIIKGRALCSTTPGSDYAQTGTPNETGGGQYCWCAGTSFGNQCSVSSPSWVFNHDYDNADSCANRCAYYCAKYVRIDSAFQRAVFGITE